MSKKLQFPIVLLFAAICVMHVYLFVSGISFGDEINHFEKETKKLKSENLDLERKLYSIESLTHAASQAAALNFTQKATPVYLNNLGIAINR